METGSPLPAMPFRRTSVWSPWTSPRSTRTGAASSKHSDEIGRAAVDMLFSKLHAGERGIPNLPRTLQVHGHWHEGRTLPPLIGPRASFAPDFSATIADRSNCAVQAMPRIFALHQPPRSCAPPRALQSHLEPRCHWRATIRCGPRSVSVFPRDFDAVIFDMDGVVTQTPRCIPPPGSGCSTNILRIRAGRLGEPFVGVHAPLRLPAVHRWQAPLPRGSQNFLGSRGIELALGSPFRRAARGDRLRAGKPQESDLQPA